MTSNVDVQTKFSLFKNWHFDKIKISLNKILMVVIFYFVFFPLLSVLYQATDSWGNLQVELISYEFKKKYLPDDPSTELTVQ